MAISNHFLHICDIQRPYSGSEVDAHGLSDEEFSFVESDVRFRLVEKRERMERSEDVERMVVTTYTGLFAPSVDLQEKDQLVNVRMADGTAIDEEFVIEELLTKHGRTAHHVSVELERVS